MIGYLINGLLSSLAIFCYEEEEGNSNTIFYNGKIYYEVVYDIYSNVSEQINLSETQKMTLYFEGTHLPDYVGNEKTSWGQKWMNILNSYYVFIGILLFFLLLNLFLSNMKENGRFLTLLLSISVFSSITFYFSYYLENNDSILISSLYFCISMYLFYYGLDLLLDIVHQSVESNNKIRPNQKINFSYIKGKIILLSGFTLFCYLVSCSHSNDLYVVPFIISFLSLIYYVSKIINMESFRIIHPLSDLFYIILGFLWIFQIRGIKKAKKRNLIYEEAGILMIEYNLYSYIICKYYSLEKLLSIESSCRKEKPKLITNQLSQPITLKDVFILIILLVNLIIFVFGLISHNTIAILAAQYGLLRLYVFFISSKGIITHTLGEIIIILLMLLFSHSFNILRELILREIFSNIFLFMSDFCYFVGKSIMILIIFGVFLYSKEGYSNMTQIEIEIYNFDQQRNRPTANLFCILKFYIITIFSYAVSEFETNCFFKLCYGFISLSLLIVVHIKSIIIDVP